MGPVAPRLHRPSRPRNSPRAGPLPRGYPSAGVLALAGPFALASNVVPVSSSAPAPLGVFLVALVVGVVIYLAARRARRALARSVEVPPMRPNARSPRERRKGEAPKGGHRPNEAETRRFERGLTPLPAASPPAARIPQRRGYAAYALPPSAAAPPPTDQRPAPPPLKSGFAWTMAAAYAAIAAPLLALSPYALARLSSWLTGAPFPIHPPPSVPYLFSYYDGLVQALGQLIYWPESWPGPPDFLQGTQPLLHTAADYIFTMYLVLMLAFLVSAWLNGRTRLSNSQRATAAGIVIAYVVTALFTDVFFYAIRPGLFYSSLALVGRAFLGGLFFSFLLFTVLMAPPVVAVNPRFHRARGDIAVFFLTAAASLASAFLILYGAYVLLGVGGGQALYPLPGAAQDALAAIALLLLLPLTALTIWALIGRSLYKFEIRLRPVPPLWKFHPSVSVLIPAYNEEASIAATIAAVDRASRLYPGSVEILVGNDGSLDATSVRAREALGQLQFSEGRVLDLAHGGKASALNGALREAQGEVVVRLDADTRISSDHGFAEMVPHFADPEVGGVQGLLLPLQREGWTRKLRMLELVWNHLFLRRAFYGTRTAQVVDGAFCAFRRADVLAAGGWVPWNGEDTEVTQRLQRIGFRFRYETRAVAYEDVPANYRQLKKQRIRWTRGGYFAHHRHYPAMLSSTPEFGGLAFVIWLAIFVRGGMRHMVYIYAALMTVLLGLGTLWHLAIVIALLLLPRAVAMIYYLGRLRAWGYLPWILTWPFTSALKQFISVEGFGSILPGSMPEFSE